MIELEITPEHDAFIQGEDVAIWVRISNTGKTPVEFPDPELALAPQPVFSLRAPESSEPVSFAVGSDVGTEKITLPKDAAKVTIEPSGSWEGVVELNTLADLSQPGTYQLSATFEWENAKAASETERFTIEPQRLSSVHLGFGQRPTGSGEGEIAVIHRGDQAACVYSTRFMEVRPSIAEAIVDPLTRRADVGADASSIAVPRRNTPFFDEMLQWLVWQEGDELRALSTLAEEPLSFKLPKSDYRCVLPPLKVFEGPLDVFVADSAAKTVALMRFAIEGGNAEGGVLWEKELPKTPTVISAALGPEGSGSERHIVFVADDDDGLSIYHARCEAEAAPEEFKSVRVDDVHLLGSCAPAVYVESDGSTIVGLLAVARDSAYSGSYIEAKFAGDGTPGAYPGIAQLGYLPGTPQGAAVLLTDDNGEVVRRDAVVDFGESGIFKMGPEGGLTPVATQGMPTTPILLAPGKNTAYILYTDPERGLYLEPI